MAPENCCWDPGHMLGRTIISDQSMTSAIYTWLCVIFIHLLCYNSWEKTKMPCSCNLSEKVRKKYQEKSWDRLWIQVIELGDMLRSYTIVSDQSVTSTTYTWLCVMFIHLLLIKKNSLKVGINQAKDESSWLTYRKLIDE